jgi:hypothetical protein
MSFVHRKERLAWVVDPRVHPPTVNCYVLDEVRTKFELAFMRNKSEVTPMVNNFVEILLESVRRLKVSG